MHELGVLKLDSLLPWSGNSARQTFGLSRRGRCIKLPLHQSGRGRISFFLVDRAFLFFSPFLSLGLRGFQALEGDFSTHIFRGCNGKDVGYEVLVLRNSSASLHTNSCASHMRGFLNFSTSQSLNLEFDRGPPDCCYYLGHRAWTLSDFQVKQP